MAILPDGVLVFPDAPTTAVVSQNTMGDVLVIVSAAAPGGGGGIPGGDYDPGDLDETGGGGDDVVPALDTWFRTVDDPDLGLPVYPDGISTDFTGTGVTFPDADTVSRSSHEPQFVYKAIWRALADVPDATLTATLTHTGYTDSPTAWDVLPTVLVKVDFPDPFEPLPAVSGRSILVAVDSEVTYVGTAPVGNALDGVPVTGTIEIDPAALTTTFTNTQTLYVDNFGVAPSAVTCVGVGFDVRSYLAASGYTDITYSDITIEEV